MENSVKNGIVLGFGLHGFQSLAFLYVATLDNRSGFFVPLMIIGLTQWVYLLPAALIFLIKKETATMAGILIAGGLTFLLNILGCGVMLSGFKI